MRILILSDMHREFNWVRNPLPELPTPNSYDVIVFAGDIGVGTNGILWALDFAEAHKKPKIYVNGNHEYYKHNYAENNETQAALIKDVPDFHLLNPGAVVIGDTTFIGATLWSNFSLSGYPETPYLTFERSINDFKLIKGFPILDMVDKNADEKEFILRSLENVDTDKVVVVTHFMPSQMCIHPKYLGSNMNPYFANDCDYLMDEFQPELWIYGHTHDRDDQIHKSGTRLVGNPMGYPGENQTPYTWKIVEV